MLKTDRLGSFYMVNISDFWWKNLKIYTCSSLVFLITILLLLGCTQGITTEACIEDFYAEDAQRKIQDKYPLFRIKVAGKWGFINKAGQVIVTPAFNEVKAFSEGLAAVRDQNGKVGYIDTHGKIVVQAIFDEADPFHSEKAGVKIGRKWGFINKAGQVIISPQFEYVGAFSEERAPVKNGSWSFLDQSGKLISLNKFIEFANFSEGVAVIIAREKNTYKTNLIDRDGKIIADLSNFGIFTYEGFKDKLLPVYKKSTPSSFQLPILSSNDSGLVGFINVEGRIAIPLDYSVASDFQGCLAPVKIRHGKWGLINTRNQFVISPLYDTEFRFSEGLAAVKTSQGSGFIDRFGKMIIEPRFSYASKFSEGLAAVQVQEGGKWGFIDHTGKFVIPPQFDKQPYSFVNGLSAINTGSKLGYINKVGQYVWSPSE